jgi:N-terminal domain of anti-restriction factor ArdC
MARTKRRLTAAERDARRPRDRERLAEATRALLSSDGWQAWLRARAVFHNYSLRNTLLIAQEARRRAFTPTHVAGFKAWLKLGRSVRKGERGMAILAPVRVKERDAEGEETSEGRVFFRTAYVWDVSQTAPLAGVEPAPLDPPRAPVEGDSHAGLLRPLEGLAGEVGHTVAYRDLERVDGLCDHRARRITVADRLAPNGRVAVLVHELAHALVGREAGLAKELEELLVEAVAYVVCAGAGLDPGADSVPYIAGWAGGDALEQLQKAAELIDGLARRIEQAIAPAEAPDRELVLGDGLAPLEVGQRSPPHPGGPMPRHDSKPTDRQLRYLRHLAEETGTTFTPPTTRREASEEIERLKQRSRQPDFERRGDLRTVSRGLVERQPASSVRGDEVRGWGSSASWR